MNLKIYCILENFYFWDILNFKNYVYASPRISKSVDTPTLEKILQTYLGC